MALEGPPAEECQGRLQIRELRGGAAKCECFEIATWLLFFHHAIALYRGASLLNSSCLTCGVLTILDRF